MISGAEILAASAFMPQVLAGGIFEAGVHGTFDIGGGASAFEESASFSNPGHAQNPFAAGPAPLQRGIWRPVLMSATPPPIPPDDLPTPNPALAKFDRIRARGIRTNEDIELALEYIETVSPRFGADLVANYRAAEHIHIAVDPAIKDGSYTDILPVSFFDRNAVYPRRIRLREGAATIELVHELVHALGKNRHPSILKVRIFPEQLSNSKFGELRTGLKKGLFHEESDAFGGEFMYIDEAMGIDPDIVREEAGVAKLFDLYRSSKGDTWAKLDALAEAIPKLMPGYRRQANIVTALWALAAKTGNERNPNFSMKAILDRVTTDEKAEAGSTRQEAGNNKTEAGSPSTGSGHSTRQEAGRDKWRVDPVKAAKLFYELMRKCFGESDLSTIDILNGALDSLVQSVEKGKTDDEVIDSLISAFEAKFDKLQFTGRQETLLAAMDGAADLGARGKPRNLSNDRGYLADKEMAKVVVDGWGGALRLVEKLRAEGRVGGRDFNRILIDIAAHSEDPRAGRLFGKAAALAHAQGHEMPEMLIDLAEGLIGAGYYEQAVRALKDGLEARLKKEKDFDYDIFLNSYIDAVAKLPPAHRTGALSNLFEKWDPYSGLPVFEIGLQLFTSTDQNPISRQPNFGNESEGDRNLDKTLTFVSTTARKAGKLLDMIDGLEGTAADDVRRHIKRLDETVRDRAKDVKRAMNFSADKNFTDRYIDIFFDLLRIPAYFEDAMSLIGEATKSAHFLNRLLGKATSDKFEDLTPSQRLRYLEHVLSYVRRFANGGMHLASPFNLKQQPIGASSVYYFNMALRDIAKAAINSEDVKTRTFALGCLEELGRGKESVKYLYLSSDPGKNLNSALEYTPYEYRIKSIMEVLEKTEDHAADTRPFLDELIEYHKERAAGIKRWENSRAIFELTTLAARTGHMDLAREAYQIADEVYRRLEGQPPAKMSDALQGFEHAGRYIWWRAMIDAGEDEKMYAEAGSFIGELEADLNGRVRYFAHDLLAFAILLDQHGDMAEIKEGIFEQVIARHIARFGSIDQKEFRLETPDLIRAIDESKIPADAKDRLLCKLIEGLSSLAATGGLDIFDALLIFMAAWKYAKTGRYPEADKLIYKKCSFILSNLENAGGRIRHQDIMMALGEAAGYILAENPWLADASSFGKLWDINDSWEARRALAAIFPEEAKRAEPAILPDGNLNIGAAAEGFVDTAAFSAEVFARLSDGRLEGDVASEAVAAMISGAIISCGTRVIGGCGDVAATLPSVARIMQEIGAAFASDANSPSGAAYLDGVIDGLANTSAADRMEFFAEVLQDKTIPLKQKRRAWKKLLDARIVTTFLENYRRHYLTEAREDEYYRDIGRVLVAGEGKVPEKLLPLLFDHPERREEFFAMIKKWRGYKESANDENRTLDLSNLFDVAFFLFHYTRQMNETYSERNDVLWRHYRREHVYVIDPWPNNYSEKPSVAAIEETRREYLPLNITLTASGEPADASELDRAAAFAEIESQDVPGFVEKWPEGLRLLAASVIRKLIPGERNELLKTLNEMRKRGAKTGEMLCYMFQKLGWAKFGQLLSVSPLMPAAVRDALGPLQDEVPPSTKAELIETLRGEMNGFFHEIDLDSISWPPKKSGSIGEVIEARLKDGRHVAIKVITMRRRQMIDQMLKTLEKAITEMQKAGFAAVEGIDLEHFFGQFRQMITREMDLSIERRMMRGYGDLPEGMIMPHVVTEMRESKSVLIMDWIEGRKLNPAHLDVDDRRRYARGIAELTRRVAELKPFHGDPHPGNFMVMKDGILALLDFGQVEEVEEWHMDQVLDLALSAARNDPKSVADALIGMGEKGDFKKAIPFTETSLLSAFNKMISNNNPLAFPIAPISLPMEETDSVVAQTKPSVEIPVAPADRGKLVEDVRQILARISAEGAGISLAFELLGAASQAGVKIEAAYTAIFKHYGTAEGVIRALDPDFDTAAEFRNQLMAYGQQRYGEKFWEYAALKDRRTKKTGNR